MAYPPLGIFRFSREAFEAGIETHIIDKIPVRVFGPENTLGDCSKHRNKIGLDVALEALRFYGGTSPTGGRRGSRLQAVLEYARACRVERVMRPYLEAAV